MITDNFWFISWTIVKGLMHVWINLFWGNNQFFYYSLRFLDVLLIKKIVTTLFPFSIENTNNFFKVLHSSHVCLFKLRHWQFIACFWNCFCFWINIIFVSKYKQLSLQNKFVLTCNRFCTILLNTKCRWISLSCLLGSLICSGIWFIKFMICLVLIIILFFCF